ncbi:hypothetical protein STCU_08951 [Strigomonas culicis]|uniref:Guanine nucleotide-binding protein subunit beta-like protein n=1 Tax=Strigomonas culicis TaxID=28005 RepID=S9TVG0_9TRYP|nr:hypothetical protein STCU_08951 [Strigomonas culicis]|eukprot:EPY20543.1 hypothetical protein STCU_08951 [Strigomonas culicis]
MLNVTSVDVNARACCSWLDEVWVAKQQGGLQIFNSTTNEKIKDVNVSADDGNNVQLGALIPVLGEIWATTLDGKLLVISATSHTIVATLRLPGEEKKAALTALYFNGYMVLVASETGRVFMLHPVSKKQVGVLTAHAPCTAVTTFYSFILTGDRDGRLYLWDGISGVCLAEHDKSKSEVLHLFHELTTGTIWVARKNGNLDLYTVSADQIALVARAPALGRVTGLVSVSGNIMVSTFEKKLFVLCARTGNILKELRNVHSGFLHGITKVQQQEKAVLWTFANDTDVKVWEAEGAFVPAYIAPRKSPYEVAQMAARQPLAQISENAALGVKVQQAKRKAVDVAGDLRAAREEAQEMRLRLLRVDEKSRVDKEELLKLQARVNELVEEQRTTQRNFTDEQQKNVSAVHERTALQSEVSTLKEDLSKARTDAYNKMEEASRKSQEVSEAKTEKSQMEMRLQDAEVKLATVQAENARLCRAMGSISISQCADKDVQNQILSDSAKVCDEAERLRRVNRMMSSAISSMVYTIRAEGGGGARHDRAAQRVSAARGRPHRGPASRCAAHRDDGAPPRALRARVRRRHQGAAARPQRPLHPVHTLPARLRMRRPTTS